MKRIYHTPQLVLQKYFLQDVITASLMNDEGVGDMGWEASAPAEPIFN